MSKFYLDAGTTWSKILEIKPDGERIYSILPSCDIRDRVGFEKVTGHSSVRKENYVNEVVALARGAKKQLEGDNIILDLGSRDVKWVKFKDDKFHDMDWNSACASATGATVEMLLKFYDVKVDELSFECEKYPITCGIFGLEKIMDEVSQGIEAQVAISKFIHGVAFNAYNFSKNPKTLFVSGGFCENKCFMDSLNHYCKAIPLGRFVLAEGLAHCT